MLTLENQRHELFVQELAKGKSAHEAYTLAGYKPSRKNAARLRTNEDIRARLAELQAATAKSNKITIESICAELDEATQVAKQKGQAAAMVSASALRAKLGGLMVEKVEVGGTIEFGFNNNKSSTPCSKGLSRRTVM
jgi:phage terminase small subunit